MSQPQMVDLCRHLCSAVSFYRSCRYNSHGNLAYIHTYTCGLARASSCCQQSGLLWFRILNKDYSLSLSLSQINQVTTKFLQFYLLNQKLQITNQKSQTQFACVKIITTKADLLTCREHRTPLCCAHEHLCILVRYTLEVSHTPEVSLLKCHS
jgi:hypothetical protein